MDELVNHLLELIKLLKKERIRDLNRFSEDDRFFLEALAKRGYVEICVRITSTGDRIEREGVSNGN